MATRVATVEQAATAFTTLADAEESVIPTYARICRAIAADPSLHSLLLEAPTGQRLPVLLLAAIHDLVLRNPESDLRPWYPSVSGQPPSPADPTDALVSFMETHRTEITELVRVRRVQTNEVNRCVAWRFLLGRITNTDRRPIHLVELGTSAGLNLNPDAYACDVRSPSGTLPAGPADSPLRLFVHDIEGVFSDPTDWRIDTEIVARVGIDENPLDLGDPDDARWLRACTWPEQIDRFRSLDTAIDMQRDRPLDIRRGDMVEDLALLLDEVGPGLHAVVLSSWALAYVARPQRVRLLKILREAAANLNGRGSRLTLLTLESARTLDWLPVTPAPSDAPAETVNASVIGRTDFGPEHTVEGLAVARCHAHMRWMRPL